MVKLNDLMDWNIFIKRLETLRDKERKSNAGRKPFEITLMFMICILDEKLSYSGEKSYG